MVWKMRKVCGNIPQKVRESKVPLLQHIHPASLKNSAFRVSNSSKWGIAWILLKGYLSSIKMTDIIRKTKCFRPAKRNVQKEKRNVFVLDTLPNHIKKIALERLSCQILTLFLYLLISVYPITTSRLSISANFKPQSLAALKSSFSSTSSMATSTSALARSEKYFSVFCFWL